jgi:hypothetical protein
MVNRLRYIVEKIMGHEFKKDVSGSSEPFGAG